MTKKKRYKRYSPEFKREALMRASEEGVGYKRRSVRHDFALHLHGCEGREPGTSFFCQRELRHPGHV
ncbi:MAG: hypothetical protein ACKVJN_00530 [Woeseiales bacterium]